MTFAETVKTLPDATELRRRCNLEIAVNQKFSIDGLTFTENFNGKGADRFFWEDGSGNEANIIFKADNVNDDSVLAFVYDHESGFNFYSRDKNEQITFDGLPESFTHLLTGPELKWGWDDDPEKIVYATGAAWLIHGDPEWKFNSEFAVQADADSYDDGGFKSIMKLFATEPTVLDFVENFYYAVEDDKTEAEFIEELKTVFKKHGFL